jgi:hypothetical protein
MRGPGMRLDLDVRRVWRCPQCGKQRRLGGEATTATCTCGARMQLAEERHSRFLLPQPLVSRELTVASFELTEDELSPPAQTSPEAGRADAPELAAPSIPIEAEGAIDEATSEDDGFGAGLDEADSPHT